MTQPPFHGPIVTLFRGNTWFLPYTLYQARKANPTAEIILLGDHQNRHLGCICTHHRCDQYATSAERLKRVYRHKSIWGHDFEYVCIERWFILAEFMEKEGLTSCLYLDSDILVYNDLTAAAREFPPFEMTWTGYSAHINFIADRSALNKYCDFVVDTFLNHESSILDHDLLYSKISNGELESNISDMSFFFDFNTKHPGHLLNIAEPRNGTIFDITIEEPQGMLMENGFKKIIWKDRWTPFATDASTLESIRLHTIHFWTKSLIKTYFRGQDSKFIFVHILALAVLFSQKIVRKLKKIAQRLMT